MRVVIASALLLVSGSWVQAQQPERLPESYVLRGAVREARTGAPLAHARIWPMSKGWGAVTDSAGHYELHWQGHAVWTFIVRHCGEQNLTTFQVDFLRDSIVRHDLSVTLPNPNGCSSEDRVPWAVDARDTTRFRGHYTYSWEGGGWLKACDGSTYSPDWDSKLADQLRTRQRKDGQITFVTFRGRVAPDNIELAPGMGRIGFHGPLYLVSKVEEVRDPRPNDCA